MARKALDTLLLGILGEIHAGETIPETYEDLLGATHKTDFKRLEELGYVEPEKAARGGAADRAEFEAEKAEAEKAEKAEKAAAQKKAAEDRAAKKTAAEKAAAETKAAADEKAAAAAADDSSQS